MQLVLEDALLVAVGAGAVDVEVTSLTSSGRKKTRASRALLHLAGTDRGGDRGRSRRFCPRTTTGIVKKSDGFAHAGRPKSVESPAYQRDVPLRVTRAR